MKRKKEITIGLVVIVAIGLLVVGLNYLKGINIFSQPTVYYGVYERINGLEESNPIMINGYKIGQVRDIKILNDGSGRLLVTMMVDKEISIPKDTKALLKSGDLLGSMQVHFLLGESPTPAVSGDTLSPEVEGDLVDEVNAQLKPIKMKAESLISSVDSVIRVIEVILNAESQQNLIESFKGINNAIASLERTSFRVDTLVAEQRIKINSIFTNIDNLSSTLSDNTAELDNIIKNFSQISDTLAKADIATTVLNANAALVEVQKITEKINSGEGSLGMLINNPDLYKKLESASNNLDLLVEDLRVNPNRYVQFSVFGRKNTKSVELSRSELEELKEYVNSENGDSDSE
ncbi:MlaD family protein [Cryomorphaceae bacterium 1068]|nr:MlaD family protein [Cryomorphaceae bacterium 1068]